MATKNTTKTTKAAKAVDAVVVESVADDAVEEKAAKKTAKPIIPKDVDLNQYITVRNGFNGKLIYESPRTGEVFVWDGIGSEQDMELKELRNMKNTAKAFFQNNWVMFNDDEKWVIDFLGVRAFYNAALSIEDIDGLFDMKPAMIAEKISSLSKGQKRTIAYRAMEKIREKEIDSISVIETLEKYLGVDLIEK